jgi:hypothetical protein
MMVTNGEWWQIREPRYGNFRYMGIRLLKNDPLIRIYSPFDTLTSQTGSAGRAVCVSRFGHPTILDVVTEAV